MCSSERFSEDVMRLFTLVCVWGSQPSEENSPDTKWTMVQTNFIHVVNSTQGWNYPIPRRRDSGCDTCAKRSRKGDFFVSFFNAVISFWACFTCFSQILICCVFIVTHLKMFPNVSSDFFFDPWIIQKDIVWFSNVWAFSEILLLLIPSLFLFPSENLLCMLSFFLNLLRPLWVSRTVSKWIFPIEENVCGWSVFSIKSISLRLGLLIILFSYSLSFLISSWLALLIVEKVILKLPSITVYRSILISEFLFHVF